MTFELGGVNGFGLSFCPGDYISPLCITASGASTSLRADFGLVLIGKTTKIDRLSINSTAGAGSSTGRLAIYRDDGAGRPGALVIDAGTVATTGTGALEVTGLSVTLTPGAYWFGVQFEGGTPTITSITNGSPFNVRASPTGAFVNGWGVVRSGAFPASLTGSTWVALSGPPLVFGRVAA